MAVLTRAALAGKIDAVITSNANGEITGAILNDLLKDIKDSFAIESEVAALLVDLAAAVHTHAIEDVIGLATAIAGKADTAHTHAIGDVTNLQTTLDGKAASVHSHEISDVTGLQTELDEKVEDAEVNAAIDTALGERELVFSGVVTLITGTNTVSLSGILATDIFELHYQGDAFPSLKGVISTGPDQIVITSDNGADDGDVFYKIWRNLV